MFLPGLAEIKMLYEQLKSNRMFNNRRANRSVDNAVCVLAAIFSVHESITFMLCGTLFFSPFWGKNFCFVFLF